MSDHDSSPEIAAAIGSDRLSWDSISPRAPMAYDFRRTDRMSPEHRRALLAVHERFARDVSLALSAFLSTNISVSVENIEQISFGQFCAMAAAPPTCCFGMVFRPSGHRALVELSLEFAVPALEIHLGGSPASPASQRELTEIEFQLIESLFNVVFEEYAAAWQGLAEIDCIVDGRGSDPDSCGSFRTHESVAAVQFSANMGDIVGKMNIVIPMAFLRSLRQDFGPPKPLPLSESTPEIRAALLRKVESNSVTVEAQWAGLIISMDEATSLVPGDVIILDRRSGEPVRLSICAHEKYWGKLGSVNGKRAFAAMALLPAAPEV